MRSPNAPGRLSLVKSAGLLLTTFLFSATLAPRASAIEKTIPISVGGFAEEAGSITVSVVPRVLVAPGGEPDPCAYTPYWSIVVPVDLVEANGIPTTALEVINYIAFNSAGSGFDVGGGSCGPAHPPSLYISGNANFNVCVDGQLLGPSNAIYSHGFNLFREGCLGTVKSKVPSVSGFHVVTLLLLLASAGGLVARRRVRNGSALA